MSSQSETVLSTQQGFEREEVWCSRDHSREDTLEETTQTDPNKQQS